MSSSCQSLTQKYGYKGLLYSDYRELKMTAKANPRYVSHAVISHDVAEDTIDEMKRVLKGDFPKEQEEKIKLKIFEDVLRRFESNPIKD